MINPLWADIQAQGENVARVVEHLYGPERGRLEEAAISLRNDRPIALIGVASAAYLCTPAEAYLAQRGRYASVMYGSDALYHLLPALQKANVIISSRSGETAEVVKLGKALAERHIPFTALTNEPQSTLAALATHLVWTNTRKDDLVSINVVTGMMVASLALAAATTGDLDQARPAFERLGPAMTEAVNRASAQSEALYDLFRDIRPIYLLARGPSKGAALCGRLVIEEVARAPAVTLDGAEFRQGPNEVVDERFGAIVFVPGGQLQALSISLASEIARHGGRVLCIGAGGLPPVAERSRVFPVLGFPDHFMPVLEVVPVQLLAYRLAEAQGFSPGSVRYITKVITGEMGFPIQDQESH